MCLSVRRLKSSRVSTPQLNVVLKDENVRKSFFDQSLDPAGGTAEQYGRLVQDDSEKYERLVKELNVQIQ